MTPAARSEASSALNCVSSVSAVASRSGHCSTAGRVWRAVRVHETDARVEDTGLAFLAGTGDDERLRREMVVVCHRYHAAFSTANAFGSSTA